MKRAPWSLILVLLFCHGSAGSQPDLASFAGTIELSVDSRNVAQRIVQVHETLPLCGAAAETVLLFPKWLPGDHAPSGRIDRIAGLIFTADGVRVPWYRDPNDAFTLHVETRAAKSLEISFQYLAPTLAITDEAAVTNEIVAIRWPTLTFYPARFALSSIMVHATVSMPGGFHWATALADEHRSEASGSGSFAPVPLDILFDSPLYAGSIVRRIDLDADPAHPVRLTLFGDSKARIAVSEEQLALHRALIREADSVFGTRSFGHYDLLVTLSAPFGISGLEHRQSSEVYLHPDYFDDWKNTWDSRYLLAHEYVHAWNGKWRIPAGLYSKDLNTDLNTDLLWIYEGQTQYWAKVLTARSGIWSKQQALDDFAVVAARYAFQAANNWRPLIDSSRDPIINPNEETGWHSVQRFQDYYDQGELVWLEADALLRDLTHGASSLDQFARDFFASGGADVTRASPYELGDVVASLRRLAPYDWAEFFHRRVYEVGAWDPVSALQRAGYDLAFNDAPGPTCTADDARLGRHCFPSSIGLTVDNDGTIHDVDWNGPAFRAGIAPGMTLLRVEGHEFRADQLAASIKRAVASANPIEITVRSQSIVTTMRIPYHGGLRYPHLVRMGDQPTSLDRILSPATTR